MTLTSTHSDASSAQFPLPLATALFSFLYHLASYEAGGEALVSCGMMESLLRVINWPGTELEHVTVSIVEVYFPTNLKTCSFVLEHHAVTLICSICITNTKL
jgi:E3 ubiquitin-protein ligase HUWE1